MRNFDLLKEIGRASLETLVVTTLIAVVILFFWLPFVLGFLGQALKGPRTLSEADLARVKKGDFVRIVGEKSDTAGTQTEDGKPTHDLKVLLAGRTILLVRAGLNSPDATTYEGMIDGTPAYCAGEVQKLINEIKAAHPGERVDLTASSWMLDSTRGRLDGAWHLLWGLVPAFCLWLALRAWREMGQPELHPLFTRTLAGRGDHRSLAAEIDREVNGAGYPVSSVIVTPHWLVQKGFMNLSVMPLDAIAWTYKKVTTTKAYGIITTNVTYQLVLKTFTGQSVEITCKEDEVMRIMELVYERVPWVVVGYSKELESLFNTRRAEFMRALHARKAAVEAGETLAPEQE